MSQVRLNKYLAGCGVCARRKADELIAGGAVTIDGAVARLGASIDPAVQKVRVRGSLVAPPRAGPETIVLNKPAGIVTTMSDERGRRTVASLLQSDRRLFPIGRLDAASTGVLLCTTDGELARILTHPSFGVEKVYRVRAAGALTEGTRAALGASNVRARAGGTVSFDVTLREGKNRQVRRMCAQAGLRVLELQRIRFGPVTLGTLALGKTRSLKLAEKLELERLRARSSRTEKVERSDAGESARKWPREGSAAPSRRP